MTDLANDPQTQLVIQTIFVLLSTASLVGAILSKHFPDKEMIKNLNARIRSWWVMVAIFFIATLTGKFVSIALFGLISFLALREFITLTPTKQADHRTLFLAFFVIMPIQYLLLASGWLSLYLIFIPVYAYLLIPIRNAIAGDTTDFLGRTAKIQWALLICVYFISYAPALLDLKTAGDDHTGAKLLYFFVFIVQISDVLQYVFGKLFGKHKVAPSVSPNKTLEGLLGGVICAVILGVCLYKITPFNPWQAGAMALVIALMGFAGGLVMSAIKRDRGVKDYGSLITGHGGMIDRIDSMCFAAPVFYHLTRHFFAP